MWIYIYTVYIHASQYVSVLQHCSTLFFLDFVITYCWTHIWAPYVSCKTHHCNVFKAFQKEHIFENMCRHGATASIRRQMLDCINVLDFNLGIKVKIEPLSHFCVALAFFFWSRCQVDQRRTCIHFHPQSPKCMTMQQHIHPNHTN